jgi:hypothetical protein
MTAAPNASPVATPGATQGPTDVGCPAELTTAGELVGIGVEKAASCFGQTELTIEGYTLGCGGCGGVDEYERTPDWLAMKIPAYFMGPKPGEPGVDATGAFPVFVDPTLGLVFPPPDTPVRVTGHFNDPRAMTCHVVPRLGTSAPPLDPDDVVAACQRSFVVTAATVLSP